MRERYGVKIYFDPVSTAAREEDAKDLARQVLQDQSRADDINTVSAALHFCSFCAGICYGTGGRGWGRSMARTVVLCDLCDSAARLPLHGLR